VSFDNLRECYARTRPYLHWVLYVLIVLACGLRIWEVFSHNPVFHIFSDTQRHWDHGKDPLSTAPMVLFDPPLFQMWMSLVEKWSLGIPELVATYAAALSVITPWLWYRFLREMLHSRSGALAGWLIFALLPSWLSIFSYFMSETLFLPLLGLSLWQTARAKRKQTSRSFCSMVIFWTLTALTRGIALPLAGIAGLWVWWSHPRKLQTLGLSILISILAFTPFAYRNHNLVGLWSPVGNGWLNQIYAVSGKQNILMHLKRDGAEWVYVFGSPSLYAKQFQPLTDWSPTRTGTVEINVDLRNGAKDWQAAFDANAVSNMEQIELRAKNLILVLAGQSWPDNNPDYLMGRMSNLTRWLWLPLLMVILVTCLTRWRETVRKPLVVTLITVWLLFQGISLIVVNEGRYRKPFEGLLIVQVLILLDRRKAPPALKEIPT